MAGVSQPAPEGISETKDGYEFMYGDSILLEAKISFLLGL